MTPHRENDPPDRILTLFDLYGSVHALDLSTRPWMVGLCQPVLDTMRVTDHVEAHLAGVNLVPVSGLICELDAIIRKYGVDPVWHGLQEVFEKLPRGLSISFVDQTGHRELAGSVNCDKEIQLPFCCLHLSYIDVEEPDWVALELLPLWLVAVDILKPGDPFAIGLEPCMDGSRVTRVM